MNAINSSPEQYLKSLILSKIKHTVQYTGASTKIIFEDGKKVVFTSAELAPKELAFVSMARADVIGNSKLIRLPERNPVFSHIYNWRKLGDNGDMAEIDINSAFWLTAYLEGILSDRIFRLGESVRKEVRLIAFGSAAAVRRSFYFDGERYADAKEEINEDGRRAYFYVASKVTAMLRGICDEIPGEAALYWVDAIVCTVPYCEYVQRRIFEHGYAFKTKHLIDCNFRVTKEKEKIWTVIESQTGRLKEFRQYPKRRNFETINLINSSF